MKPFTNAAASEMQFHVIEDVSGFLALEDDWNKLWHACAGQNCESFFFCHQCLVNQSAGHDAGLWCLTGRRNGELALVWPLVVFRQGPLKIARPLSSGAADYTVLLVDAKNDIENVVGAAWKIVASRCGADIIRLPYIREDRPFYACLSGLDLLSSPHIDDAPLALLKNQASWENYCRELRLKPGRKPKDFGRRLAREGHVTIETYERGHPEQCETFIDWLLFHKIAWAKRVGKSGNWLESPEYRNLLVSLLKLATPHDPYSIVVMKLDDTPVAACLIGGGASVGCAIIGAYDEAYARLSPGAALMEYVVRWALDRGLDLDLGVGTEAYKRFWSKENLVRTVSLTIPLSTWGRGALLIKQLVSMKGRREGK